MLQEPQAGRQAFQVVIYNKDVRAMVKDNQPHCYYDDHWADGTVQAVEAKDESEARRLLSERYPPEAGFVVQSMQRRTV